MKGQKEERRGRGRRRRQGPRPFSCFSMSLKCLLLFDQPFQRTQDAPGTDTAGCMQPGTLIPVDQTTLLGC